MSELKNKDMKHLLANTEESIQTSVEILKQRILEQDLEFDWEDIREATWQNTSVTEDMRRMNVSRIIGELTRELRNELEPYAGTAPDNLIGGTTNILDHYVRMGAIAGYEINESSPDDGRVEVTVHHYANLERVIMDISLSN